MMPIESSKSGPENAIQAAATAAVVHVAKDRDRKRRGRCPPRAMDIRPREVGIIVVPMDAPAETATSAASSGEATEDPGA